MASLGFCCPTNSLLFSRSSVVNHRRNLQTRFIVSSSTSSSELVTQSAVSGSTERPRTSLGLKNLTEIFWVDVHGAEGRPLNVGLQEPVTVGCSRLEKVENVAVRVELSNGCVGWGEVSVVPWVNWNQATALEEVRKACEFLSQGPPVTLNLVLHQISEMFPGSEFASVRAGLEMALVDAVANSIDVPLWRLFGGVSDSLSTAATIPTTSSAKAFDLAAKYCKLGFKTLEIKLGRNLNADIEVLQAVRTAHPHCLFILDANEGYTSKEAIEVLHKLNEKGVIPTVFEQPVHRDDWRGLGDVSNVARHKYGVSVAADESCRDLMDIQKLMEVSDLELSVERRKIMGAKVLFFFALLSFSAVSAFAQDEEDQGLVMNFYKDSCPQAEDIIKEQVKLLYKRHKNTAFSWLRNIFHDCAVQSCDASLLLDSTRRSLSEKETDRSFGLRNFRYIETIKEAVERECPGVVSCADILVLSAREGIVSLGGPYIPLKTGRRDGRRSRADVVEEYLPDHNETISGVLDRFAAMGIDTPGVVALLGAHSVGRTHCVKLVHRLYPEVDPALNPDHVPHMLHKCPDQIPDPKAVQYVRNDRGTPMVLDNNYYRNILDNKGLLIVDHQLAYDKRTRPYVKKMAKSQDYFFKEFSRAITLLSENNPLTGSKGEIRKQCNLSNKLH